MSFGKPRKRWSDSMQKNCYRTEQSPNGGGGEEGMRRRRRKTYYNRVATDLF